MDYSIYVCCLLFLTNIWLLFSESVKSRRKSSKNGGEESGDATEKAFDIEGNQALT